MLGIPTVGDRVAQMVLKLYLEPVPDGGSAASASGGDVYLRMLLIHGARAVLHAAKKRTTPDGLRAWALRLEQRCGHNRAAVAVANKMARIVWAVWRQERDCRSQEVPDAPTGVE